MPQSEPVEVETLVIGAGAAGLMAAIRAAERGANRVVLLEAGERPARKILISGNGRCNLTNIDADDPGHYHSSQPRFPRPALNSYSVEQALSFFHDLGVVTRIEKRGRLFPISDQAQSIIDLLIDQLQVLGAELVLSARVDHLGAREGGGFDVRCTGGRAWHAECVIVTTGGVSVPKLGANDSGMGLCEVFGHQRTDLRPGLVPLKSDDTTVRRMRGVRVWAKVSAQGAGGRQIEDTDDLLFTRYGVSGFTILNLSARLVPMLSQGPQDLHISLLPDDTAEMASEMLLARWQRHPHRTLGLSLAGLLHWKVARPLLESLRLNPGEPVAQIGKKDRWALAQRLTDWIVTVTDAHSFDHAEVTIGGLRTDEVDPHTMESFIVPGLYVAGEVLDVHGDLGGYNFQWAWASGHVAGERRGN